MDSKTPNTDKKAEWRIVKCVRREIVDASFARLLEEELNDCREALQKISDATRIDSINATYRSWADMKAIATQALASQITRPHGKPESKPENAASTEDVVGVDVSPLVRGLPYPTCHHCEGEMKHTMLESWCSSCGFISNMAGCGWPHEGDEDDLRDSPPNQEV